MIAFLINEMDIRGGTHKQFIKLLDYVSRKTDDFMIITKKVDYDKTYPEFIKYQDKVKIFDPVIRKGILDYFSTKKKNTKLLKELLGDSNVVNIHDNGFDKYFNSFDGRKVIWQVNDLPGYFLKGASKAAKDDLKKKLSRFLIKNRLNYIDIFTVNVSKNKERIRECFQRDAEVLYCGIEPINIKRDIDKSISNFINSKINILSSGVFFPYRNYETQIKVIKKLRENGIDARLKIIGAVDRDKIYSNKIKDLIETNGLSEYITIAGQVNENKFKELHGWADIFMFINIDQSWGLAVFEAMSAALPVLVSESVGATEILHNGEDSVFVNPTDTDQIVFEVQKFMSKEEYYRKISKKASEFHKDYSWDKAYSSKMYKILTE